MSFRKKRGLQVLSEEKSSKKRQETEQGLKKGSGGKAGSNSRGMRGEEGESECPLGRRTGRKEKKEGEKGRSRRKGIREKET